MAIGREGRGDVLDEYWVLVGMDNNYCWLGGKGEMSPPHRVQKFSAPFR